MAMHGRKSPTPTWAKRDYPGDLSWINQHMPKVWKAAQRGFGWCGRGALEVDTTAQPGSGQGIPWEYLTLQEIKARGNVNEIRMVQHYDPIWEFVIRLRKPEQRVSTYRMVVTAHKIKGERGR